MSKWINGSHEASFINLSGPSRLGAKPILWSNETQQGQANMLIGWLFVRRDPTMQKAITELNAQIIEQIKSARGKANDA